jgi:hypothetical protein
MTTAAARTVEPRSEARARLDIASDRMYFVEGGAHAQEIFGIDSGDRCTRVRRSLPNSWVTRSRERLRSPLLAKQQHPVQHFVPSCGFEIGAERASRDSAEFM